MKIESLQDNYLKRLRRNIHSRFSVVYPYAIKNLLGKYKNNQMFVIYYQKMNKNVKIEELLLLEFFGTDI